MKNCKMYVLCALYMLSAPMCLAQHHNNGSISRVRSIKDASNAFSKNLLEKGAAVGAKVQSVVNENIHTLKQSLPMSVRNGKEPVKHLSREWYKKMLLGKGHEQRAEAVQRMHV